MTAAIKIVSSFATALDAEDYEMAESFLASDCVYESPVGTRPPDLI